MRDLNASSRREPQDVRVVGYVRDASGPSEVEPAFAQAEKIRRWVNDAGHQLVAVCQDVRTPGHDLGRHGFRAMVGIIEAGEVDGVVVPDLTTLSADKVTQEVMLWDLRRRGTAVLSTDATDLPYLADQPEEQLRIIVRDVLAKAAIHLELLQDLVADTDEALLVDLEEVDDGADVIVELIPPAGPSSEFPGRVSPAR